MFTNLPRSLYKSGLLFGLCCVLFAMALSTLAACGSSSSSTNPNAPLLVWVDATRLPGAQLYQKLHPDVKMKIVVVDRGTFAQKVLLFNRAGSGWPDVIFDEPQSLVQVEDATHHYPGDLTPYVSQSILNNFAPGAISGCEVNGKLYCLPNDLAQDVLWYNATLMKQFGYTVPTTWEEYQALGERVAKEHPGYVIGSFGDSQALHAYFWSSECPVSQTNGSATSVHINLADPNCTRMANLLQPLLDDGAISKLNPFDPGYIKLGTENKILMMPAASWYGQYVFKPTYKTPAGQLSVALPLKWSDQSTIHTGAEGGGGWAISSHSQNPQAAANMVIWMSTNNAVQATAPTFPAYLPAADAWSKSVATDPFYASNPYPILKQSSGMIDTEWKGVRYDDTTDFNTTVITGITHGQTLEQALLKFGDEMDQLAQAAGYTVTP